ncbi:MerR family transcriptional regulator [Tissierella sp. MSJ-40]|uniref:MerR family transcriptional regulator n=1 Tax=Tissierella simiarum TaxID=2841534 RepID=A0ABS6E5K3_9FIRM|nr:MerR family transcriptional regulator [Tissierella simiarum]
MYTIGEFSKIGGVSTKTLRYYDEMNILKPAYVNNENQYRYYSQEQVLEILFIIELKEYGLTLDEIKKVLEDKNIYFLQNILEEKLQEINKQLEEKIKMQSRIERKIKKMKIGGKIMESYKTLAVQLKDRAPMTIISQRTITDVQQIDDLICNLYKSIERMNLKPSGPVMSIYHDKEFDPESTDLEVCIPVNKNLAVKNSRELAGGLHACTTFIGPYSRFGEAYAKVIKWIQDNGYQIAGAPFDIYIVGPDSTDNSDEYVTEICFPVKLV